MSRLTERFCAAAFLLAVAGCALAPRSTEVALTNADSSDAVTGSDATGTNSPAAINESAATMSTDRSRAPASPPAREPTDLLALVQSLRSLSPAQQDQLLEDLKQTDPSLWPIMTQQFKASLEYRERQQASGLATTSAAATALAQTGSPAQAGGVSNAAAPHAQASALPVSPADALPAADAPPSTTKPAPVITPAASMTASPAGPAAVPTAPVAVSAAVAAPPSDWRQPLSATIASVEQSLRESPGNDDRQIYLRLLHLIAGHRDQALELVAGREPSEQEFWSKELYALSTLWDASRQPDQGKRRTEAAIHFDEASGKLRELGLLTIRNLAFCTEVNSYGVYKRFEKDEFRPQQRVLLYAELENFVSQATPQGFHTSLKASYQIFDSRGAKVEEQDLPPMEEYCQNPRRDFFVAYSDMQLPKQIYDGRYTMKLTIEDALGKKIAQSSIEFMVKNQSAELATR